MTKEYNVRELRMKRTIIAVVVVTCGILLFVSWEVRAGTFVLPWKSTSASEVALVGISLENTQHNFGTISMKRGLVTKEFTVRNTRTEPIIISRISTTCTCMTATLHIGNASFGPSNNPQKEAPRVHAEILPGHSATLSVTFDPRAHGPAGIGKIVRRVLLDYDAKTPLSFRLSAFVTP